MAGLDRHGRIGPVEPVCRFRQTWDFGNPKISGFGVRVPVAHCIRRSGKYRNHGEESHPHLTPTFGSDELPLAPSPPGTTATDLIALAVEV